MIRWASTRRDKASNERQRDVLDRTGGGGEDATSNSSNKACVPRGSRKSLTTICRDDCESMSTDTYSMFVVLSERREVEREIKATIQREYRKFKISQKSILKDRNEKIIDALVTSS